MVRRCSVIRSPLSAHRASMSMLRCMAPELGTAGRRVKDILPGTGRGPRSWWRGLGQADPLRQRFALPPPRSGEDCAISCRSCGAWCQGRSTWRGAALFGIIGRDHRIVGVKTPLLAILVGSHLIMRHQVPLEHLQALPVFEADDIVGLDRRADRNLGLRLGFRRRTAVRNRAQRGMNILDKLRQVIDRQRCCC